jgi:hypothetical protein
MTPKELEKTIACTDSIYNGANDDAAGHRCGIVLVGLLKN